jgi:hypothetical protein
MPDEADGGYDDDTVPVGVDEATGRFVFEPLTGPTETPVITPEQFQAGYVPNDDDYQDFFGPVSDLAQAGLQAFDATWRADVLIEKGRDVHPAGPNGVRATFFMAGCVWMMKYMEAATGEAMNIEDFAVSELDIEGPSDPPE